MEVGAGLVAVEVLVEMEEVKEGVAEAEVEHMMLAKTSTMMTAPARVANTSCVAAC